MRLKNSLVTDLRVEVSFTQRWVFVLDVVYSAGNRTKFNGNPGLTADGLPATIAGKM